MDAKQLRIGNTVEYNLIGENVDKWIVTDVDKDDICDTSNLRPIPLTEEWLVKFGFVKKEHRDGNSLSKNQVHISSVYGDNSFCLNAHVSDVTSTYIKYVHQLENLYFALTDEELTIK